MPNQVQWGPGLVSPYWTIFVTLASISLCSSAALSEWDVWAYRDRTFAAFAEPRTHGEAQQIATSLTYSGVPGVIASARDVNELAFMGLLVLEPNGGLWLGNSHSGGIASPGSLPVSQRQGQPASECVVVNNNGVLFEANCSIAAGYVVAFDTLATPQQLAAITDIEILNHMISREWLPR